MVPHCRLAVPVTRLLRLTPVAVGAFTGWLWITFVKLAVVQLRSGADSPFAPLPLPALATFAVDWLVGWLLLVQLVG